MPEYTGPIPVPSPETRPFWDAAKRHALELPRCRACGTMHYYPRGACPACLSGDLAWERVSGKGTLHTFTIVNRGQKGFPVPTPYVLAIVELDEGPRLTSNIVAAPESVKVGMPVVVQFDDVTPEHTLVKFKPV